MGDTERTAIGDVTLIPLIVGLIQFLKRFFPSAHSNVWFGLAFLFGLAGQTMVFLIAKGTPDASWTFATWAVLVVTGLWFGLASTQAYDGVVKPMMVANAQLAAKMPDGLP